MHKSIAGVCCADTCKMTMSRVAMPFILTLDIVLVTSVTQNCFASKIPIDSQQILVFNFLSKNLYIKMYTLKGDCGIRDGGHKMWVWMKNKSYY